MKPRTSILLERSHENPHTDLDYRQFVLPIFRSALSSYNCIKNVSVKDSFTVFSFTLNLKSFHRNHYSRGVSNNELKRIYQVCIVLHFCLLYVLYG